MSDTVHATAVALWRSRAGQMVWSGVLIQGASGMGKSDLALRLLEHSGQLVADDRVHLWASGQHLYARAPRRLSGLIEARTVGILNVPYKDMVRIELVIRLEHGSLERFPERDRLSLCGIDLPLIAIDPRPSSAATLVVRALEAL